MINLLVDQVGDKYSAFI